MARATIPSVNKALKAAGIEAEIFRGNGYFYFSGPAVEVSHEQGVYGVFRISDLSVEEWVEEAKEKAAK